MLHWLRHPFFFHTFRHFHPRTWLDDPFRNDPFDFDPFTCLFMDEEQRLDDIENAQIIRKTQYTDDDGYVHIIEERCYKPSDSELFHFKPLSELFKRKDESDTDTDNIGSFVANRSSVKDPFSTHKGYITVHEFTATF